MKLRSIAGVFMAGMVFTAVGTYTAQAAPPPNPGPPSVEVTVPDAGPAGATASCVVYASKPNHSGSSMTGTGGFESCSGGPAACNSEVDLEFYNNFSGMWMTAATSARQYKCAPPLRSTTAKGTCTNHPGDPNVGWRTATLGTIVSTNGSSDSRTAYSPVLYVPCA